MCEKGGALVPARRDCQCLMFLTKEHWRIPTYVGTSGTRQLASSRFSPPPLATRRSQSVHLADVAPARAKQAAGGPLADCRGWSRCPVYGILPGCSVHIAARELRRQRCGHEKENRQCVLIGVVVSSLLGWACSC